MPSTMISTILLLLTFYGPLFTPCIFSLKYDFRESDQQWEKRNIEGSLFITKRSDTTARFKLVVLNRNSTQNLEVPITKNFQMQLREPYLIFRPSPDDVDGGSASDVCNIRGLWFHNDQEQINIHQLLEKVIQSQQAVPTPTQTPIPTRQEAQQAQSQPHTSVAAAPVNQNDIAQMLLSPLTSAENNTDTSKGANNSSASKQRQQKNQPQQPISYANKVKSQQSQQPRTQPQPQQQPRTQPQQQPKQNTTNTPPPTSSTQQNQLPPQNLVLDKKSLQLSLLSLLQDERFLDLIHAQYLKVAHARATRDSQNQKK